MSKKSFISSFSYFICFLLAISLISINVIALKEQSEPSSGSLVKKKDQRKPISSSEYGEISAVSVRESTDLSYHLQFITLEPFALFLPVVLHADMVFYVHTGSGKLSYINEGRMQVKKLIKGDAFGLGPGTIFFIEAIQCMDKLKIYAIFGNSEEHFREPATSPYSSFRDLLLGFDKKILQETFKVPVEVIEEIMNTSRPPAIVSIVPAGTMNKLWEMEARFFEGNRLTRSTGPNLLNLLSIERGFESRYGWSTTINKKKLPDLKGLKGSRFGIFMTNLTSGSMVAPHWNAMATEIAVVLQGKGMVRVVCSSINNAKETECKNMRFRVEEGDVFVVPRFYPTAQMSFTDDTFVFMGFSTTTKKTNHQLLVGKISIFKTLGKRILAASLGVNDTIINPILGSKAESVVLGCNLCAEEEARIMEEEIEKEKQRETGEGKEFPEEEQGEGKELPEEPIPGMPEEQGKGEMENKSKGKKWAGA